MNNITLAHIGGELVLIGGVAFYFHRKTNTLQEDVNTLKKENKELSDAVEDLQENLQRLGTMFMQLQQQLGGRRIPQPQPQPREPFILQPQAQPQPQPREPFILQPQAQQVQQPNPMQDMMQGMMQGMMPGMQPQVRKLKKKRRAKSDSEDSGEEAYDDRELDKDLVGEMKQLNSERQQNCTGETCQLIE